VCFVVLSEEEKKDLDFLLFHLVFDEKKGKFTGKELHDELEERYASEFDYIHINKTLNKWSNLGWIRENAFDYQVIRKM
jgi:hypothetical protein